MITLGGLWKHKTRGGKEYLSGNFGTARIMVFANERKQAGSNAPDYSICIAEKQDSTSGETDKTDPEDITSDLPF